MNRTRIEWCDVTWNPVLGCKRGCSYCYANKLNDRFHWIKDFSKPEWRENSFNKPMPKKPSRIFVNSMSDVCYWENEWMIKVIEKIKLYPQHTFMFLTKDGTDYKNFVFPHNCWLGVTYTEHWRFSCRPENKNNLRFVSIEPLLKRVELLDLGSFTFDWWIVGGLSPRNCHEQWWVDEIIKNARLLKKPIFLKSNLKYTEKIQEYPK